MCNSHPHGMCSGSEAGSYLVLIDSCITHRKAQGLSGTCSESKEEEEKLQYLAAIERPYTIAPNTMRYWIQGSLIR